MISAPQILFPFSDVPQSITHNLKSSERSKGHARGNQLTKAVAKLRLFHTVLKEGRVS